MSKIYEALIKAQEGSKPHQPEVKLTAFHLFKDGRHPPKIAFDMDPQLEEQYQKLRLHFLPSARRSAIKVIMVAATTHGEGSTTTAAILASTLARSQNLKVLLVDANCRTPALDGVFPDQETNGGLSDLILSEAPLDKSIYQTNLTNLSLLPCGKPVSSPSYLFDGESITHLLVTLRDRFDFIIFDASPLNGYSESYFLAPKVDGVVLVVEAERTRAEVVRKITRELDSAGVNILGVVLNKKKKYIPAFIERIL